MQHLSQSLCIRTLSSDSSAPWEPFAYEPVWKAMQEFTAQRDSTTQDEIWLLNHDPVFTQGQAGKAEHILVPGNIPVVQIDRGGQVTYHGPGQLVAYLLLDVRRSGIGVRELVERIEASIIAVLKGYSIASESQRKAPGVYVNNAKIAALGLRIRNGRSYHGLSFNIAMDLSPFSRINPCGYAGMEVTQLRDLVPTLQSAEESSLLNDTADRLSAELIETLEYTDIEYSNATPAILASSQRR